MEKLLRYSKFLMILIDIVIISLSAMITNLLLGDVNYIFTIENAHIIINSIISSIIVYEFFLNIFRMYRHITRFESGTEYLTYIAVCIISGLTLCLIRLIFKVDINPIREQILSAFITATGVVGVRIIIRGILNSSIREQEKNDGKKYNVLIIGAGYAGREIIIAIQNTMKDKYNIVGIIDDDISKLNRYVLGVKVLGRRYNIPEIVKENEVDIIFFAISKIDSVSRRKVLEICQETGVKTRVLPTTEEVIDKQGAMNSLRDVQIEDLLGRDAIQLDNKNINSLIKEKTVLVTGGGGSIGSELCRQIIKYNPKKLIILDIYENNLYDIEIELKSEYPNASIEAVVASIRDKARLNEVFEEFKPEIIFHAAAHKHVPLMENNPLEAVKNNVFGTYNVVNCADEYKVEKFVLISTDKAVNPTNIMGASKRMCEMIVQAKNKVSKTEYVAVRFGNVLGSNGSVIPLFKKQIEKGGPVTVTHKDITRFFMTIPEAVQLILQAVTYAKGGEIFVLDMGEPVKIYDLAVSLIKLLGYEPNVDMPIEVTGLRPGEKLYEEILMAEEGLEATKHDKIFVSKPIHLEMEELEIKLSTLGKLGYDSQYSKEHVKEIMKSVVPTYKEPKEVNNKD